MEFQEPGADQGLPDFELTTLGCIDLRPTFCETALGAARLFAVRKTRAVSSNWAVYFIVEIV